MLNSFSLSSFASPYNLIILSSLLKIATYSDPLVDKCEYYLPFHLILYDADILKVTYQSAMVRLYKITILLLVLEYDPCCAFHIVLLFA